MTFSQKLEAACEEDLRETLCMIQEIFEDLEHSGLIYDTGRRRNGQIAYAATPKLKSAIESEIWSPPQMPVRSGSLKVEPGKIKR